jgi:hypothetical protein
MYARIARFDGLDPSRIEGEGQRSSVEILEVVREEDFTWD